MDSNNTELRKCYFFIPTINKEYFGNRLRELRKKYVNTQKKLNVINNGDISEQSISQWENGKKMPNLNTFLNLCHFFRLSPDKMLRGTFHTVFLELPEPLQHRSTFVFNYLDPKTLCETDDCFYCVWPDIYSSTCYPFLGCTEFISFDEAMQIHLSDLGDVVLETNYCYENSVAWPKKGIQQFITLVDDEKTREKINSLLIKHNLSDKTLQILLGYKSIESIKRLKNGKQKWDVYNLYKLSWILDIPFEDLLVYKSIDYTQEYDDFFSKKNCPSDTKIVNTVF